MKNNKKQKKTKYLDYVLTVLPPEYHSKETRDKAAFWKQIMTSTTVKPNNNNNKSTTTTTDPFIPPSILILGINGMSRLHSIRALPLTRKFLQKNSFVEMKGFTKNGLNTFTNTMTTLTGLRLTHDCYQKPDKISLDSCSFIWKDFSEENYITALVEDSPGTAMFNYEKIGFVHQPVDYTTRTGFLALHKSSKVTQRHLGLHKQCMNGLPVFDNLFRYVRDFLNQIAGQYPFFMITWFKTLKSDFFNSIANYDKDFEQLLSNFIQNPRYNSNNTFIFVLSSHGQPPDTNSYASDYEQSLPMNFIRIPPSLQQILPDSDWVTNLEANSKLLTTPFDLHRTLKDILALSDSFERPTRHGPGYSLFEEIDPAGRSCSSSSIPELYCRCDTSPELFNTSKLAVSLGNAITSAIQFKILPVLGGRLCVPLQFSRVVYGRRVKDGNYSGHFNQLITFTDYLVGIEVVPSLAMFEATVRDSSLDTQVILDEVKRVSPVRNESFCVKNPRFTDYCFCYDSHLAQRIQQAKQYMKWSSKT